MKPTLSMGLLHKMLQWLTNNVLAFDDVIDQADLIHEHTSSIGAVGLIKFNGVEYVVQMHAINSKVKVLTPLTPENLIHKGGFEDGN